MKYLLATILVAGNCFASDCPQFYPNKTEISVPNTIELCNSFYVSRYDSNAKAVKLTANVIIPNKPNVARRDAFHADARVPTGPKPGHYTNTGYDRGHMTPADDASTPGEMYDSFLMTNMTPQEPTLNRISWKELEQFVRHRADTSQKTINVVTIAVYNSTKRLPAGELVPTGYWKVLFYDNQIQYFYADNVKNAVVSEHTDVNLQQILKSSKY